MTDAQTDRQTDRISTCRLDPWMGSSEKKKPGRCVVGVEGGFLPSAKTMFGETARAPLAKLFTSRALSSSLWYFWFWRDYLSGIVEVDI